MSRVVRPASATAALMARSASVRVETPERFENSVFTGKYVTQDIDDAYLNQLELFRSDKAKEARRTASSTVIDLHNAANR